ncbi:hypothetical protein C7B80_10220 [Cyanosarcina cf. burmensis CCALA 770]|nr:hypothetical protein C7B80_10220 [Cyanosarcina cf. burmensis CCALA 770]
MGKPYSDLEKQCIAILANGGNPANSQDEAVAKYWQWKINPSSNAHKFTGDLAGSKRSAGRKLSTRYIKPFDAIVAATTYAAVTMSARSLTEIPQAVRDSFGFHTLAAGDQGIKIGKFKPAKVYYRTGASETSSERTSRVTGREYKSYYTSSDQGYTAPFGVVGSDTEAQRQTAIRTALGSNINLVTFTPQIYRRPV